MNSSTSRRNFIKKGAFLSSAIYSGISVTSLSEPLEPMISVLNPRNRVPVSFIIDDSTALVNMAHYGIPQFKEVFPKQYLQDWQTLPREIPDTFVMEFGEWCRSRGVKGKYSMVPYPACTGWLHRFIPGWSKQELKDSLQLVREFMMEDWDIHPEMISHTRVIDIKKGLPYPYATPDYMENWEWSQTRSADELTSYIAYALTILKEAGLACEGITTPGGFGSRNMENLALGTLDACREVFDVEIPHFFRDVRNQPEDSVTPELYHVSGIQSNDPRCSVHIIGCTGDWFGGWDGLTPGDPDRFITEDLEKGRMVEVIDSGQPAIMVCHWPGLYYNGTKLGFDIFKTVVNRLNAKYDHLIWKKNSEIARYWACKELTDIKLINGNLIVTAPFGTPEFTLRIKKSIKGVNVSFKGSSVDLQRIDQRNSLKNNSFYSDSRESILCFNLPRGESKLEIK